MAIAHNLGFPRIGAHREMKHAIEAFWKGEIDEEKLEKEGQRLRAAHWAIQAQAGIEWLPVGDFSWYDHVLDMSTLLGAIPTRFKTVTDTTALHTYLRMARGQAPSGQDVHACEMTKWFDTNYHYIVPEFIHDQHFSISNERLFVQVSEAQALGYKVKPILLGPLSYLFLGKSKDGDFDKLTLLPKLLTAYEEILTRLQSMGVEWVQMDEPILVLDLPVEWKHAFHPAYERLKSRQIQFMLTTYFGALLDNTAIACSLPISALHIDITRSPEQLSIILQHLPEEIILSIGIVDGRNIWRTDLNKALDIIEPIHQYLKDRLWIAGSCSLLHCPVDLHQESDLNLELKTWLAFAAQKVVEIALLTKALNQGREAIASELANSDSAIELRKHSIHIHNQAVARRCMTTTDSMARRINTYPHRQKVQHAILKLPLFPTTTIGSFPQTQEIRKIRHEFKAKKISEEVYCEKIRQQITSIIYRQQEVGLDVLAHGEPERTDMVEYFGELLEGFAFTQNGWVQSYGSRCVKPPIIFGDVSRPEPMTTKWIAYAQSLTKKPVKGMLTGPITILCWSFVRDDQPRFETAKQIALALRDEVLDLEQAGIKIIQIDEPAFREGLPLRRANWEEYLKQAVHCFKLASCGVQDATQIHTHMCYAEFNDIIAAIAELDADVITMETSRSDRALLKVFEGFQYPNEIGPGVYDIHSPCIPSVEEIITLLDKAATFIPIERIWVNPDCGLKTREWKETEAALKNMVRAAQTLRARFALRAQV